MRLPAATRIAASWAALLLFAPSAGAQPADAAKIFAELGFPADTLAQLKAGKMVEIDLKSSNERELGVGLAFLAKEKPMQLVKSFEGGLLASVDENVEAHGAIRGPGSLDQFTGVKLGELEDAYRNAKGGSDLNLSSAEIAAFQALKGKPAPTYYDTLLNYPKKPAAGYQELYNWQRYNAHGSPVFILTHAFFVEDRDAVAAVQRQFYVSGGYNLEQAMAGFLPVSEGTLVIYLNRTSTDQVAGFGGGAKRSMGKKLMASQLEELYGKVQKAADK